MRDHSTFLAPLIALLAVALLAGCAQSPAQSTRQPETREYELFSSTIDLNETQLGIPHDIFSPDLIVAHSGDTVVIHFHNLEDTTEHHTFTMGAPYAVNRDVAPNEEINITIHADTPGVFTFTCTYHQPTMTGHLLVIN